MFLLPPPADVTLELLPMPLSAACERFSAATGETWKAAAGLGREIVAVRLDHAPLGEVKTRLAKVLEAKWDGNTLVPDETAKRARDAENTRQSQERYATSLAYLAKRLAEQPAELTVKDVAATARRKEGEETLRKNAMAREDWSNAFRASRAEEETPVWRVAARLAPTLPFTTERTVYSDLPTPMQKRLPVTIRPILDAYRKELKIAGKDASFTRVRVKVEPWGEGSGTSLFFTALGSDGKTLDATSLRMNGDSELMNKGGYTAPAIPDGPELPISDETKSYFLLVNNDYKDKTKRNRPQLRLQWADRLSHPVEHEPLVWQRGEAYVRTAAAAGKQMVAWMSDFQNLRYDRNSKWVPGRFLPPVDNTVNLDGDWMIVGSREVPGRIDRAAAGILLRESIKQGGVPIEAAATFAAASPPKQDTFLNWVADALLALFTSTGGYSALSTIMNENGLRLWGNLAPGQKVALRTGKTLRIGGLPGGTREEIRRAVFDIGALEGEPTDLLPNGLEDGDVSMKVEETPLVLPWNSTKGEPDETMPLTASSLGKSLALGIPYFEVPASEARSWDRYRMGVYRVYNLTIHFDRGPSYEEKLTETLFSPTNPNLTALPPAFAAEVAKARANAKPPAKNGEGTSQP